jgi:hypothetical protein
MGCSPGNVGWAFSTLRVNAVKHDFGKREASKRAAESSAEDQLTVSHRELIRRIRLIQFGTEALARKNA